jgi:anti-sigma regulatory factor (Ser/Thr protein kinase)
MRMLSSADRLRSPSAGYVLSEVIIPGRHPPAEQEEEIRFFLPGIDTALRTARRRAGPLRDLIGPDLHEVLVLLLTELVANALRHAALGPFDRVEVRLQHAPGFVRTEVLDPGSGFDAPEDPVRPGVAECGYGLFFVSELSTRWGAERTEHGMRVWFELDLLR